MFWLSCKEYRQVENKLVSCIPPESCNIMVFSSVIHKYLDCVSLVIQPLCLTLSVPQRIINTSYMCVALFLSPSPDCHNNARYYRYLSYPDTLAYRTDNILKLKPSAIYKVLKPSNCVFISFKRSHRHAKIVPTFGDLQSRACARLEQRIRTEKTYNFVPAPSQMATVYFTDINPSLHLW